MAKTIAPLLPSTTELLQRFGERLRLARRRRRLTAKQMAERAGMAPMTLRSLERGGSGVTMGAYLAVMQVLGIEKDMDLLGAADLLGRELQDARLTTQGKPTVRTESSASRAPLKRRRTITAADAARDRPAPAKTIKAGGLNFSRAPDSGYRRAVSSVPKPWSILIDAKGTTPKKMR
ncbi:helix-turn-helix domain-containing protein [Propionivibrio sp.]|uniref:helix-turn-helix domain-containing protein n=1 Tax=Propionivibrio sp. TaxID=2212460 RepID=UPI0025DA99C2|nr:helix-turn-helix domain-containing protein [Propionivibrio sp.]MBK8745520.1 helix-turn-helix domain-containing protein [Propionivibrio sp.]